jgi:hypothetical protein
MGLDPSGSGPKLVIVKLFCDPIDAVTGIVAGRNYLQSGFAAKHADESPDRMFLPSGQLLNFRQAHALGPPQPRNYLSLLAAGGVPGCLRDGHGGLGVGSGAFMRALRPTRGLLRHRAGLDGLVARHFTRIYCHVESSFLPRLVWSCHLRGHAIDHSVGRELQVNSATASGPCGLVGLCVP